MKTNGSDAAFADDDNQIGLTKREYFAAMAMQGIVMHCERGIRPEDLAALMKDATILADALIKALNEVKDEK